MKNILITGVTGFVGSHMADFILKKNLGNLHGIKRWRSPLDNIKHINKSDINLYDCDLRDLSSLIHALKETKPDIIFHFAAQSYVPTSYIAPVDTIETNTIGTINLFEAIRFNNIDPVVITISTSEVYGDVKQEDVPIKETHPLNPISPYAISKVGEDLVAYMYWNAYGIKAIRSRMFTHTGPRRYDVFFESSFARQLVQAKKGVTDTIYVGNLNSIRTIADIRDSIEAYWLLYYHGKYGDVYNIGGETTLSVGDVLNRLIELADVDVKIEIDPKRLRPADATLQIPDVSKFKNITGWKPKYSLDETLQSLLDYWYEND